MRTDPNIRHSNRSPVVAVAGSSDPAVAVVVVARVAAAVSAPVVVDRVVAAVRVAAVSAPVVVAAVRAAVAVSVLVAAVVVADRDRRSKPKQFDKQEPGDRHPALFFRVIPSDSEG